MRGKLILFLVGLLLGAGPVAYQYWQVHQRATAAESRVQDLDEQVRVARLRNQLASLIFDVQDQNFGRAREVATKFFGDLQDAAAMTTDEALRAQLETILGRRDELIADLASLNPQSAAKFRDIYSQFP